MKKSITPLEIRQTNRQRIYQYIYQKENVSQQDIAYDLHLSRPTVTMNLNALKKSGSCQRSGTDGHRTGRPQGQCLCHQ